MGYLIWTHDPGPEGGWHIHDRKETFEEAKKCAEVYHEEQIKDLAEYIEFRKKEHEERGLPMPPTMWWYDKVMVTSAGVFELEMKRDE